MVCWKIANAVDNDQNSNYLDLAQEAFSIGATTIALRTTPPSGLQGSAAFGWPLWDYTQAQLIGYVSSISGAIINLDKTVNAGALVAGSANDLLVVGPWVVPSGGAPTRENLEMAMDVANVAASPIDVASCAGSPAKTASGSTPAIVGGTTFANDTLISIVATYVGSLMAPPPTGDELYRGSYASSAPYVAIDYEYLSGAGSATSRTWTMLSGTNEYLGCAIAIKHN